MPLKFRQSLKEVTMAALLMELPSSKSFPGINNQKTGGVNSGTLMLSLARAHDGSRVAHSSNRYLRTGDALPLIDQAGIAAEVLGAAWANPSPVTRENLAKSLEAHGVTAYLEVAGAALTGEIVHRGVQLVVLKNRGESLDAFLVRLVDVVSGVAASTFFVDGLGHWVAPTPERLVSEQLEVWVTLVCPR